MDMLISPYSLASLAATSPIALSQRASKIRLPSYTDHWLRWDVGLAQIILRQ